jgi:hypothetical protein
MKKYLIKYLIFIFYLIFTTQTFSVPASLVIEELGTNAHAISLGNIGGFSKNSSVLWENPAGLKHTKNLGISSFYCSLVDGQSVFSNITTAYRLPWNSVIALGFAQNKIDNIYHTQKSSVTGEHIPVSTFDYVNAAARVAIQQDLNKHISLGMAANYYYKQIFTTIGRGYNLDTGLLFSLKKLQVSLVAKNILPLEMKYFTDGKEDGVEQLRFAFVPSIKYYMDDFNFYAQLKENYNQYLKAVALEYRPAYFSRILSLNLGWHEFLVLEKRINGITAGVSLFLNSVNFKFAYENADYQNFNNYYFSVDLNL